MKNTDLKNFIFSKAPPVLIIPSFDLTPNGGVRPGSIGAVRINQSDNPIAPRFVKIARNACRCDAIQHNGIEFYVRVFQDGGPVIRTEDGLSRTTSKLSSGIFMIL